MHEIGHGKDILVVAGWLTLISSKRSNAHSMLPDTLAESALLLCGMKQESRMNSIAENMQVIENEPTHDGISTAFARRLM